MERDIVPLCVCLYYLYLFIYFLSPSTPPRHAPSPETQLLLELPLEVALEQQLVVPDPDLKPIIANIIW